MLKELRKKIDGNADHCNKELESIQENQSKLDSSSGEIKTNLEAINGRLNNKEEWISDLEDRIMGITQSEWQTERKMKEKKATHKIYGVI